ncbi:MAG: hypothetical protein ACXWXO_16020 [Nocardioides sp.]
MTTDVLLSAESLRNKYQGGINALKDTLDDVGQRAEEACKRKTAVRAVYFTLGISAAVLAAVAGLANLASLVSTTVAGIIGLTAAVLAAADKVVASSKTADSRAREVVAWDRLLFRIQCTKKDIDSHLDEIAQSATRAEQDARRKFFESWLVLKKQYYRSMYEELQRGCLDAVLDPAKKAPEPASPSTGD